MSFSLAAALPFACVPWHLVQYYSLGQIAPFFLIQPINNVEPLVAAFSSASARAEKVKSVQNVQHQYSPFSSVFQDEHLWGPKMPPVSLADVVTPQRLEPL